MVAVSATTAEPKPLAPGEKVCVEVDRSEGETTLHDHGAMQALCAARWRERTGSGEGDAGYAGAILTGGPLEGAEIPGYTSAGPSEPVKVEDRVLGGFGWQREDMKLVQQMAATGQEPIGSLGYDGPLACLSPERQNLADYFKESVAVVTNPAIDREREVEHFSCRAVIGARPSLHEIAPEPDTLEIAFPILFGGHDGLAPLSDETYRAIAHEHKTYLLEDLWEAFRGRSAVLDISCLESENTQGAIERLKQEATTAVRGGAELVVLSDRTAYEGDRRFLDPHLALAAVDLALREHLIKDGETNLRRRCGVVLRSAAIRNVHDVVVALGLGADAVCPYAMVEVSLVDDYRTDVGNLASALRKGIEKVISTIGIHEVRGYARLFSSIGLQAELTGIFDTPAYMAQQAGRHGLRRARLRRRRAPARAGRRGRVQAREDVPLLPEGLQGGGGRGQRHRRVRRVLAEGARPRARAADLAAPHPRSEVRSRGHPHRTGRSRRGPAQLPDRDLLDELRLPGRDRLPRLRRGREAGEHHRHERRGRRDPGHVRQVPALARPAGGLGPLRGDERDAELLVPGGDQDRPGRQARRGRPPARQEGHGEGRAGA